MGGLKDWIDMLKMTPDEEDDEFDDELYDFDDEDDEEEEIIPQKKAKPEKPKKEKKASRLFDDLDDDDDDLDDFDDDEDEDLPFLKKAAPAPKAEKPVKVEKPAAAPKKEAPARTITKAAPKQNKITPINKASRSRGVEMEVCVIKPSSMDDCSEIANTLLNGITVILNLEGLQVDVAQRIIDFAGGATYAIGGSLRKVSNFIILATPNGVDISGDITDIMDTMDMGF